MLEQIKNALKKSVALEFRGKNILSQSGLKNFVVQDFRDKNILRRNGLKNFAQWRTNHA